MVATSWERRGIAKNAVETLKTPNNGVCVLLQITNAL
jgi:hypothetical protein